MARRTTEPRPRAAVPTPREENRRGGLRRWLTIGVFLTLAAVVVITTFLPAVLPDGSGGAATPTLPQGALAVLKTNDFHALAFSPATPDVVFFGHHNGILRSEDGGRTWRPLVERRNFDAMGLAVNHANPRQIFLAGHDIFQVSNDGGASWQPVAHNLPGTDIHAFALSPDDPSRLYAFVVGLGVFRSADGGGTWQPLGGQLPGDVMSLAAAGGSPETLYAGSMRSGLLRSADGGQTWTPSATGLSNQTVIALAVAPTDRATVYASTADGLYKSTDAGATWSRLPFPGDIAMTVAVSPADPRVILAIAVDEQDRGLVFRSKDGGTTWGE